MTQASKSFEIRTARDYLEQLVHPSWEEFKRNSFSSKTAITCAIFTWHLYEWVWKQYQSQIEDYQTYRDFEKKPKPARESDSFRDFLVKTHDYFAIIRDVADGSKHLDLGRKDQPVTSTALGHGYAIGMGGMTQSWLVLQYKSEERRFYFELEKCIRFWDDLFANVLPTS